MRYGWSWDCKPRTIKPCIGLTVGMISLATSVLRVWREREG